MVSRAEKTADDREYYDCEDGDDNAAPCVEGGNDGLHRDESMMMAGAEVVGR